MTILHIAEAIRRLPAGSVFPSEESSRLYASLERLVGRTAARKLLTSAGSVGVGRMPATEIAVSADVSLRLAERVVAARDLGEALFVRQPSALSASSDVARLLPLGFATLETEVLLGFALSARMTLKAVVIFAKGGDVGASVAVRDVFVPLVRLSAAAFVLCHNHPSGDATPSREDVVLTNRLASAGRILGIELLDHIVVATGGTLSFRDVGLMPTRDEMASS